MNIEYQTPDRDTSSRRIAVGVAIGAGILATILRIVPHPPNFSGVGALGLFGGARLKAWQAILLPLCIMFASDLCLWLLTGLNPLYSPLHLSRTFVYASFLVYVAIGYWLVKKNSITSIVLAGTLGGLQFYFLTNFCEWLFQPLMPVPDAFRYSRDFSGLVTCMAAGLPFYSQEMPYVDHPFMLFTDFKLSILWTCVGDVFFTSIYVLVHDRLTQPAARADEVPAPAATA